MSTSLYFTNGEPVRVKGNYRGQEYEIVSYGSHPFVHIKTYKGSIFDNKIIWCHGGVSKYLNPYDSSFGWHYAHGGDYIEGKTCPYAAYGKKWTIEEIETEIHAVIDSVLNNIDDDV